MNKKYFNIVLFVLFHQLFLFGQPSWEKIKTPTDFNLLKVFYLDSLHCWVGGDSGVIMFSSDQGDNWKFQNSGVLNYINDIYFLNDSLGWALTFEQEQPSLDYKSKILTTIDGGNNWQISNFRFNNYILLSIYFLNENYGWVGAEPRGIFLTTNGGNEWSEATIDSGCFNGLQINKIRFFNDSIGIAVGGKYEFSGVVWKTYNAGLNWYSECYSVDPFFDFIYYNESDILTLSGDKEKGFKTGILKSYNSQAFWFYDSIPAYGMISSIDIRNNKEIWAAMSFYEPNFLFSPDVGLTWEYIPITDSLFVQAIDFADSLNGIAVCGNGYILKYIPDNPVSVDDIQINIPKKIVLEQNYPNPFNPNTQISWQSPIASHQTLKVFDILGNEVATLVDEHRDAGSYQTEFNIESYTNVYSSGIYFYQIRISNYFESKKMILLK